MLTTANLPEGFSSRRGRNMGSRPRLVHPLGDALQGGSGVLRRIAPAARAKALDGAHRIDAAARTVRFAVQPGRRATEFESMLQVPAPQKPVGEAGVKEVAGAGRVDHRHFESGSVEEALAVPGQSALLPHGGAYGVRAVLGPDRGQSGQRVVRAAQRLENA